jgi:hypothetical protein
MRALAGTDPELRRASLAQHRGGVTFLGETKHSLKNQTPESVRGSPVL